MSDVALPPYEAEIAIRTLEGLGRAGPTLSGHQRAAIARSARQTARNPSTRPPDGPLGALVWWLVVEPHSIRQPLVTTLADQGLATATYLEVVGLVARLMAVDTFTLASGHDLLRLPRGKEDEPTGILASDAALNGAWLPTVGTARPPNVLSMLPDEHEAMHELHRAFYLSIPQMADLDIERGLHRSQMELVAARTSLLNECFY